jgi:thioredoxin reductase (NADPH)
MDDGTFIGDVSMFTGEPTIAAGVAVEPTSVIAFERPELREMLAELPEFGELVLQTMTARAWLEGNEVGVLRLIASRGSGRAFEVRDLLERNLLPVRWYDVDTDTESAALLETLAIPRSETPVLIRIDGVLSNPSAAQVARTLGLRADIDGQTFDLVVRGAGPAGLAAAV